MLWSCHFDTVLSYLSKSDGVIDIVIGTSTVLDAVLTAGDYWVVMDGWSTESGIYRLNIQCPTPGPTQAPTISSPTVVGPVACGQTVTGSTSTRSHTHTRTHTHTHTHTHSLSLSFTHTNTHTHTHSLSLSFAFQKQSDKAHVATLTQLVTNSFMHPCFRFRHHWCYTHRWKRCARELVPVHSTHCWHLQVDSKFPLPWS